MTAVWAIFSTPFWLFFAFWTFLGCFATSVKLKGVEARGLIRALMRLVAVAIGVVCMLIALWMDGAFA